MSSKDYSENLLIQAPTAERLEQRSADHLLGCRDADVSSIPQPKDATA